ncbi:type II/IV secretion system protein [bacterium]|nr:type II/IV secretion system protein [candidate division CSSED10-310 bacterium]
MNESTWKIILYTAGVVVTLFLLLVSTGALKFESGGFLSNAQSGILHSSFYFLVLFFMLILTVLSIAGLICAILQIKRMQKISDKKFDDTIGNVVKPVRLYTVAEDFNPLAMPNLIDVSSRLSQIARKGESGVVELLDYTVLAALQSRASDIHIEPSFNKVTIKYRLDGVLHDVVEVPRDLLNRIISRLRVLANLTIYHRGKPQDGRLDIRAGQRNFDMRLSIMPTLHGEKSVVRLFESSQQGYDLSSLGLNPRMLEEFHDLLMKPQGSVFLTGPTGSGKTTTMYAAIKHIIEQRGETTNIVTIEDPIEREIMGVNQTQVNPKRDLTFASGLRSILRQDPDVIMVGEVRDPETAQIVTQAGLTGHLVISSIHAESSVGIFNRLIDMGIEPFLVASSVTGVLAQRLVRKNCPYCSEPDMPSLKSLKLLGIPPDESNFFKKGRGCAKCQNRGYLGRIGIFELLTVTNELREALQKKISTINLMEYAVKYGFVTLKEDGLDKVRRGYIHIDELVRVIA